MNPTPIRAIEMVRAIRDEVYEETKHLSREELKAYFAREAEAMRQEVSDPRLSEVGQTQFTLRNDLKTP